MNRIIKIAINKCNAENEHILKLSTNFFQNWAETGRDAFQIPQFF